MDNQEERPTYTWLVEYHDPSVPEDGKVWLKCRDGDEAFDALEAVRPGARFVKVIEKHKISM